MSLQAKLVKHFTIISSIQNNTYLYITVICNMFYKLNLVFILICFCAPIFAQENVLFRQERLESQLESQLFEHKLYGLSKEISDDLMVLRRKDFLLEEFNDIKDLAYKQSIASLNLDDEIGESLSQINEIKYAEPTWEKRSLIARGDYYYIRNDFVKAAEFYKEADVDNIKDDAVLFRLAYSYFVTKDFNNSFDVLNKIKNTKTQYYIPANYYYAMNAYFLDNFPVATKSLEIVKDHEDYKKYTPYYLGQLYFAQGQYDKLFSDIEPLLDDPDLYKRFPLHSIMGQAYIQTGEFRKGLDYLELYERNTDKLTETEFYQIALSYYQLEDYSKAIRTFKEISQTFNDYQVSSLYHLADCYLKKGDKQSAKSVFKYLADSNIIPKSQKDLALWNFAKLSVETGSSREAINTLVDIPSNSKYFKESRQLMVNELYQSEDYNAALNVLNDLPELDKDLKILYQDISLRQAKQFMLDGERNAAYSKLAEVEKYPVDKSILGESYYWLAKLDYDANQFSKSNNHLTKFFELKPTGLPLESSQGLAYYLKAYNHFELKEYAESITEFRSAGNSLKADKGYFEGNSLNQKLADVYSRKGDAHVLIEQYPEAIQAYNAAADQDVASSDYSLFQKGLILGLQGEPYDKILSMEKLIATYKRSSYRDQAIMEIADTYVTLEDQNKALQQYKYLISEYGDKSQLVNQANLKLGLTSYNLGDANAALTYYETVLNNNPSQAEKNQALLALKEIYVEDKANAQAYFDIAEKEGFEIDAFSKDSLSFSGGQTLFNEGKYANAVGALESYLKTFPNAAYKNEAAYMIGESYLSEKAYTKALEGYQIVIDNGNSSYYKPALQKASVIAYNHENDFVKSFEYYNKLHQLSLPEAEIKEVELGGLRSAFRISNNQEIIKYASLIQESQRYSQEEKSTANFYLAKAYINSGDKDKAIPALNNVVRYSRNNQAAEASYMISEIFFEKNQLDIAESQALETTKRSSNYPFWVSKSLILLSDIYSQRDDLLNAKAALEALIDNYKENPEILAEAETRLRRIEAQISESNRIKVVDDTILELDTIRNE